MTASESLLSDEIVSASLATRVVVPRFHALGERFFSVVQPQPLHKPPLVSVSSTTAAKLLGIVAR